MATPFIYPAVLPTNASTKNQELSDVKGIIFSTLDQTKDEAKKPMKETSKKLLCTILYLFLSIKGRIKFLQWARYSKYCEQIFRSFFALSFDFSIINHALIKKYVPGEKINIFFQQVMKVETLGVILPATFLPLAKMWRARKNFLPLRHRNQKGFWSFY